MWEFYLAACEVYFYNGDIVIYQVQIAKKVDTLPITRDYIYERERQLIETEKLIES